MAGSFLAHWFRGFEQALSGMDGRSLDALMTNCGRACSESYSRQVYAEQYRAAKDLDDYLDRLNRAFADMAARRVSADEIEIVYAECGCELARDGYVTDPRLCLCSLKSLQYNWESVLGENSVSCRMEESILRGDGRCRFTVKLL